MKIQTYTYPKSSFLSMEKDMGILVDQIMKDDRLKKLLFYTTKDCLNRPKLTEDESLSLFGQQIKIVPTVNIDESIFNYILINFDSFIPNATNPEFRDNLIEFDIVCHFNQWHLKDFELRPYKIAAEIDSIFTNKRLTGIGKMEFLGATQIFPSEEFGGLCMLYRAVHGEEDRSNAPNPKENQDLIENFDKMFNDN